MAPHALPASAEPDVSFGYDADADAVTHPVATDTPTSLRKVRWSEVAEHNSAADAWIVIRGRVYDVTEFVKAHPGGDIILTAAGRDATDVFAGFHAATDSWRMLPALCVGEVAADDTLGTAGVEKISEQYVRDVVKMRADLQRLGLYQSSKLYYAAKISTNLALLCSSVFVLLSNPDAWPNVVVAAVLLALFWQQCGWLAHDFLHHQVFDNRVWNNVFGIFIGNIWQGFSVSWWKNKHNHHHAVPNVTEAPSGGDPDILTMPILWWSEKLIEGEDLDKMPQWLLRNQAMTYWPILCMARLSWLIQSLQYQTLPRNPKVTGNVLYFFEISGLAVHHAAYLVLLTYLSSFAKLAVFVLLSQGLGGLFIGIVFTVGHNAMDVLTPDEYNSTHFVSLQVRTTRNVTPSIFNDWFTGGLNYQVEHHIWPTLPRHSLPKASQILQEFCAKHSVPYTCKGLVEGNREVCRLLAAIGRNAS